MPELKDMIEQQPDPLSPTDRIIVDKAIYLERQCAFLSNELHTATLRASQLKDCLDTVREMLVVQKEKIKDRSLSEHYRAAMHGHGLMKGL